MSVNYVMCLLSIIFSPNSGISSLWVFRRWPSTSNSELTSTGTPPERNPLLWKSSQEMESVKSDGGSQMDGEEDSPSWKNEVSLNKKHSYSPLLNRILVCIAIHSFQVY